MHPSPEFVKSVFFLSQVALVVGLVVWLIYRAARPGDSAFRTREWQKRGPGHAQGRPAPQRTPHKLKGEARPVLSGIRLDGAAHELLGVSQSASVAEIRKAYRDKMKIYHPDAVGRPGSREWREAQKIAEALNRARDTLLGKR